MLLTQLQNFNPYGIGQYPNGIFFVCSNGIDSRDVKHCDDHGWVLRSGNGFNMKLYGPVGISPNVQKYTIELQTKPYSIENFVSYRTLFGCIFYDTLELDFLEEGSQYIVQSECAYAKFQKTTLSIQHLLIFSLRNNTSRDES